MSKRLKTLPSNDGFRMPGEYEPHEAIWMAWPERPDNWRNGGKLAQQSFIEVAIAISQTTPVYMAVNETQYRNARQRLPSNISVIEMSANDCWMRDIGPTYIVNDKGVRRGVDWHFNAWGGLVNGLYFPWDKDDEVARKICDFHDDDSYRVPIILEGGSIISDGDGTLYTTEECILHPGRNPNLCKDEIEIFFKDYLGIDKVIWVPQGVYNDETNGHIDNTLVIVKPGEVLLNFCDDVDDPQYQRSIDAFNYLNAQEDAKGRPIIVHKLPMPGPMYLTEKEVSGIDTGEGMHREIGTRLAGSYANLLITNKQIVMPLLDEKYDGFVIEKLSKIFSGYKISPIPTREILLGGGNIHCITQQIPAIN